MFLSGIPWQQKLAVKGLRTARVKATDLVLGEVQIVPSFAEAPLLLAQGTLGGAISRLFFFIGHFRNERGTGAEICAAIVCGIVNRDAPVSYWSIFSLSLVTAPEVFAKVNSAQFPCRF